jgi:hypothetical protein
MRLYESLLMIPYVEDHFLTALNLTRVPQHSDPTQGSKFPELSPPSVGKKGSSRRLGWREKIRRGYGIISSNRAPA